MDFLRQFRYGISFRQIALTVRLLFSHNAYKTLEFMVYMYSVSLVKKTCFKGIC